MLLAVYGIVLPEINFTLILRDLIRSFAIERLSSMPLPSILELGYCPYGSSI